MDPESEATEKLLLRLDAGDRSAFDRLFAMHRSDLRRAVDLRLDPALRGRVDASDVVQEAHMDALNRLDDYLRRRPMPFRLWLWKTAHERLLKIRRQHAATLKRAMGREQPLPDHSSLQLARHIWAEGTGASGPAVRRELADQVRRALKRLPEIDREILLMRVLEGMPYEDVARILEIDPAAARKRYGRALTRMCKSLRDGGFTESQL